MLSPPLNPALPVSANHEPPATEKLPSITRFVGLDVHKDYVTVAILDIQLNLVLGPRRVDIHQLESWTRQNLTSADNVVLEATGNAWHVYDQLQPLVGSVIVANSLAIKPMMSGKVKTDNRDAVNLARLLAAGMIPAVWVPPIEVRELRTLVAHRSRLIKQRSQIRNRLQAVLLRHNIVPPAGELFSSTNLSWWQALELPSSEKLLLRQDLALFEFLSALINDADQELLRLSTIEPWASQVPYVLQIPGIGVPSAMTLLAAIGNISRFPSAKKLVGYAGLGASVHSSGQINKGGSITKQGRREMRTTLVQCAWHTVGTSPYWQKQFERLEARIGKSKAIVAIARKLLVVVWYTLTDRVADRNADPEKVAFKLMYWGVDLKREGRQGVSTTAFVRRKLRVLKLGELMTSISRGGKTYQLPTVVEDG